MNPDHQVSNSVKPNAKAANVAVNPKHLKKDGSLVHSEVCSRFFALLELRHTAQPVNACNLMLLLHRLWVYAKPADLQRDDDDREWLMHSHSHLKRLLGFSRGQLERVLSDLTGHGIIATRRLKYGKAKLRRTGIRFTLLGQALFDPQGTLGVIDSTAKSMAKHQKSDAALLAAQATFAGVQATSVPTSGDLKNGAHHDLKTGVHADHGGTEFEVTPDLEIGVTKRILNTALASLLLPEEVHLNSASSQAGAAPPGSCASGSTSNSGEENSGKIPCNQTSVDHVEHSSENSTPKFCIKDKALAQAKLELMADSQIEDDTTTADLERMWRRVIAEIHGVKPPAFNPMQRGQLGYLVKELAPLYEEAELHLVKPSSPKPLAASELSIDVHELAIVSYVIERVLRRWDQFATLVRNRWYVEGRMLATWPPQPHMGFLLKNVQTAIEVSWPSAVWLKKTAKEVQDYDAQIDQHVADALTRGFVLPAKKAKKPAKASPPTPAKPVQQAVPEEQKAPLKVQIELKGLALVLARRRKGYLDEVMECQLAGGEEAEDWAATLEPVISNLREAVLILQKEPYLTEPALVVRCGALTAQVTESIKATTRGR